MSNTRENMRGTPNPPPDAQSDDSGAARQPNPNTEPPPSTSHSPPPRSLASRVQTSAAGLARSAFQGTGAGAAQTLASATEGKAAGPSSAARGEGLASREIPGSAGVQQGSGSGAGRTEAVVGQAFREGTRLGAPQGGFEVSGITEEEFQRAGSIPDIGIAQQRDVGGDRAPDLQAEVGSWKGKQRAYDPAQEQYSSAWERANTNERSDAVQVPATDGDAVVNILSDTSFDPSFGAELEADGFDVDQEAAPPPLTREEIDMLESFRREVQREGGPGPHAPVQQLSSSSLVPDIDMFLQQNDPTGYEQTNTAGATSLRDDVLANLPGAEDWVDVHERYHDEVWGYLRPALEAAKNELDEKVEQGTAADEDGPAVRRLKQILRQMKV